VDADAVWLEGTGHLIAALFSRNLPASKDIPSFHGDFNLATALIESAQVAQNSLGAGQTVNGQSLAVGRGLTASTSILNTGFGFNYFPYFHIGATAWYVMGRKRITRSCCEQIISPQLCLYLRKIPRENRLDCRIPLLAPASWEEEDVLNPCSAGHPDCPDVPSDCPAR